jgi:hypothetical protein
MKYKWLPTIGKFDITNNNIKFYGAPSPYKNVQTGKEEIGNTFGQIISDQYFGAGKISCSFEFSKVDIKSSCEIIFYFDPLTGNYLSAGISGVVGMFSIKSFFNEKFEFYKQAGDRENIKEKKNYTIDLILKGSQVKLLVDNVEVLSYLIPFPLKQSQVGIFCFNQSDIYIKDFTINAEKPKAFMIMQFTEQYKELYEEVIKEVCSKHFDLNVIKADEIYGPGIILADIIRSISESKVIIAEISPINTNVFYEVGYAHALNKPTILIAEKGTKLPFDVSPFRVLFYQNTIAGKKKVQEGLLKHLDSILNQ